jgi:hypothetical protein
MLPTSAQQVFRSPRSTAVVTWQSRLDDARDEYEVVEVAKDFVATLEHSEIALLPEPCRPGKFFDANDVTGHAFTLVWHQSTDRSESAQLVNKLVVFFSSASIRLSQILATSKAPEEDARPYA